jgi:hypothetical protein
VAVDFEQSIVSSLDLSALLHAPHFEHLNRLNLSNSSITSMDVRAHLSSSELMNNIVHLNISNTKVNNEGIIEIANSPHFRNLLQLEIAGLHALTGESLCALLRSEHLHANFNVERVLNVYREMRLISD